MNCMPTIKREAMATALSEAWVRVAYGLLEHDWRAWKGSLDISKHFLNVADGIAVARGERDQKRPNLIQSLQAAPTRTCYSLHSCILCGEDITCGQVYRDRGPDRRAHYDSVPGA